MAELTEEREPVKARRRASVDAAPRGSVKRRNRSLPFRDDVWEKLTVGAGRNGMSRAAFVEKLLYEPLRRYVVQDRGNAPTEEGSAIQAGEVKNSGETLPVAETLTSAELGTSSPAVGEGEGLESSPAPTRRRRAG